VKFGFRASFVALLLAGVVLGGVGSSAEVAAGRLSVNLGGVCVREGARDRVAGKQVVCVLNVKKQLRWRLVKATTVRVVTATSTSTSVVSTTTVAPTTTSSTSTSSSSSTSTSSTSTTTSSSFTTSTTTTSVVGGDRTAPVVTLGRSSGSSGVATLTFTVTGNEPIVCSTLSGSEGVDFGFTRISRINSITQTSEDVCTISVQSTAEPGDTNPRESSLAAASTFSITDTAGNSQTTLSGSPQTIWVQRIARPVIALSATTETANLNAVMNGYTVTSSGGTVASYSITGTLPAGVSFSTTTGRITGTPTVTQAATTYTITATNTSGSTTATFTLTVVRTCANGGECIVGNTGPGGGIVFYVSAANFTSTGSDCNTTCKYLEAAPTDQSNSIVWATTAAACYNNDGTTSNNNCQGGSIYSGDAWAQFVAAEASFAIGMGMANTNQVYARLTTVGLAATNTYAAGLAWAYTNNGKSDWYLPSYRELNELCKYARTQTTGNTATGCADTGPLRTGFSAVEYYSSSEFACCALASGNAWFQNFGNGVLGRDNGGGKAGTDSVRAIRAFGPAG
jgi:hypothetical protein